MPGRSQCAERAGRPGGGFASARPGSVLSVLGSVPCSELGAGWGSRGSAEKPCPLWLCLRGPVPLHKQGNIAWGEHSS